MSQQDETTGTGPYREPQLPQIRKFEDVGRGDCDAGDGYRLTRHVEALQCELGCFVRTTEYLRGPPPSEQPYYMASAPTPPLHDRYFVPGANLNDIYNAFFED